MEETSPEVLLDLWVVLFGEDVSWSTASAAVDTNPNVQPLYQLLQNAGRLVVFHERDELRIRVAKGGET